MKQFVSSVLKTFLATKPQQLLVADCLTLTLRSGQILRYTSFDRDVYLTQGVTQYATLADVPDVSLLVDFANLLTASGTPLRFTSIGSRLTRSGIKIQKGMETATLDFTLAPFYSANPLNVDWDSLTNIDTLTNIDQLPTTFDTSIELGIFTLIQAMVAGLFYGAGVKLETIYNPTPQMDGSFTDHGWGSVIKFMGVIGQVVADRSAAKVQAVSNLHQIETVWPPYVFQPQCRWRLFDAGCSLDPTPFRVTGSCLTGSTTAVIYHALTNPSGYFNRGSITFTSGLNQGITAAIKTALGSGAAASYQQVVANDKPYVWYKLVNSTDSSGNNRSATPHGVAFSGPTLLPGDPTGASAQFNGSNAYMQVNVPRPPRYQTGVTFEFWFQLGASAGPDQPHGIFDTNPIAGVLVRALRNGGEPNDTLPGFEWQADHPFVPIAAPTVGTPHHIVCVFRGKQALDVYMDGQLWDTETTGDTSGIMGWAANWPIGRTLTFGGAFAYFNGYLQHFAVYAYPMDVNQVLTHYTAGTTAPGGAGQGQFTLLHPLPYPPGAGDSFTALPGCARTQAACIAFGNEIHFGAMPYVPSPERGI